MSHYETQQLILISSSTALIATVFFISRYGFKRFRKLKDNQVISEIEFKRIKYLFYFYIILELPLILFGLFDYNKELYAFQRFVSIPFYFVINIIPVYIGAVLFYRKYINPFSRVESSGNIELLNDSVNKIFNSKEFYHAISTVLPKGEKDGDLGLDYIPFMLQNLQEKRKRFQKSSTNFLITTICLSIFFVLITIFFSYVLLNESSIGVYSEIKKLSGEVENTDRTLSSLKIDITSDKYFMQTNEYYFDKLLSPYKFDIPDNQLQLTFNVKDAIETFNREGNLGKLALHLRSLEDTLVKSKTGQSEKYLDILRATNKSISDHLNLRDNALIDLEATQFNIKTLLPKIQNELNKPVNSQNELIKRLILSIVVMTFFLAILRYFRNLYQSHYSEMLNAERQDLIIRKFYVTLKSSENNTDERKIVLSNFLSDINILSNVETLENSKSKSQKIENDVLRDIVNAIIRKI